MNIQRTKRNGPKRALKPPSPSSASTSDGERIARINRWYDRRMFLPEGDRVNEFRNYGYWDENTRTEREACENLMEKLLGFLPQKEGAILDVACGKGATTRHLLKYFKPENVTGINISEKQLERCRENAPACTFLLMSATDLKFADASFDNIICVEAALHFDTRERFLQEAFRILKPGGRVVLSDVIAAKWKEASDRLRSSNNYVRSVEEYREIYFRNGFSPVEVMDATYPCWLQFYRQAVIRNRRRLRRGTLPPAQYERQMRHLNHKLEFIRYYVLACAQKPRREISNSGAL